MNPKLFLLFSHQLTPAQKSGAKSELWGWPNLSRWPGLHTLTAKTQRKAGLSLLLQVPLYFIFCEVRLMKLSL